MQRLAPSRRFDILLIKPSHYDNDGYVIRWLKSTMPSNSLAVVNGLALGAARRKVLGEDVAISVRAMDETNARVAIPRIIREFAANGFFGFVGLVGVQSNELPRAMDNARALRAAGIKVVIGGFHVSGSIAMLPAIPSEITEATDLGISLFLGECEEHLDEVILDAAADTLKPMYRYMSVLPDIGAVAAPPFLASEFVERTVGNVTSFDAGRGCPYQCSFCTIINVQGRKSRHRSPDSVEEIIRSNYAQGVKRFFITDDNFARNKDWEAIYDRIIKLREEDGLDLGFMIQVDTLCHKIPGFIEKSKRAGVTRVFIGLENINPANLIAAKKRQNKLTEYRRMLIDWKKVGIMTFAGYILGFPHDTPESIARDIQIIQQELPLDALEFFVLTPLPGSEDHKVLAAKGVDMDRDLNKYTLENVVTDHALMSREALQACYEAAWGQFYSDAHLETILRRAHASGIDMRRLALVLLWFSVAVPVEGLHPLQTGILRRKRRDERRPGLPREPWLEFYLRQGADTVRKGLSFWTRYRKLDALCKRIAREDPSRTYMDQALTPVPADGEETLRLYSQTADAQAAVTRERRVAAKGGGKVAEVEAVHQPEM
ncbi:MAG: radical SAM protein [Hyphomicrobiaceae bacterium]|nr:radical SAM protein [Hyphomicrobiaceae bacterium]